MDHAKQDDDLTAVVLKRTGPVSYKCTTEEGDVVARHQDQIWEDNRRDFDYDVGDSNSDVSDDNDDYEVAADNSGRGRAADEAGIGDR